MTRYKINGKQVNIHNDGVIFVNGKNTKIKQWKSDKTRYSNLSGQELKELQGLSIEYALDLKGFL
jgi:hypothetical protein